MGSTTHWASGCPNSSDPEASTGDAASSLLNPAAQFAALAEHYDRFMRRYAPTLAAALADTACVTADMRVLDVGCGPGGVGLMADPDRSVREMARVKRPGGTVVACMWDTATGVDGDIAGRFRRAGLEDVVEG